MTNHTSGNDKERAKQLKAHFDEQCKQHWKHGYDRGYYEGSRLAIETDSLEAKLSKLHRVNDLVLKDLNDDSDSLKSAQSEPPINTIEEYTNIKVNKDGTISPKDPTKPSKYSFKPTDTSQEGIIRAILLDMEWCHAVTTKSLDKAAQKIHRLIQDARVNELRGIPLDNRGSGGVWLTMSIEERDKRIKEITK